MPALTRRSLLFGLGLTRNGRARSLDLKDVAAAHVRIAEADRPGKQLWGRIGGSPAEHQSARKLAEQLKPFLTSVGLERFAFRANRPKHWIVQLQDGPRLESAFPTPFNSRFPHARTDAPLAVVSPDGGWDAVRGKWAFLPHAGTTAINDVREKLLYERAVEAGAAGLLFSIDTPPGRWRAAVRIGKYWSVEDDRYPGGRRPIPCYNIDAEDGKAVLDVATAGHALTTSVEYDTDQLESFNTVGYLRGQSRSATVLVNHLDAFFSGACDNATGIATMVGIADRLSRVPSQKRLVDFYFAGMAAHHDTAAGTRAFVKADAQRFSRFAQMILIEHTDAVDTEEGKRAGWPRPLNNERTAYLGQGGWPEVRQALPALVRETGVMTADPKMEDECVADMMVVCDKLKTFSLMNAPPFYHTDHDTLDKISAGGIEAAVNFHLRLIEIAGGVEKGLFK